MLEKDGEDQLDHHGEKLIITKCSGQQEHPTYSKTDEG